MLQVLMEIGLDPTIFLVTLALSVLVAVLAFRPFFYSFFDPLLIFVVTICSDVILMFALNWEISVKVEAACFFFSIWLGFAMWGRPPERHSSPRFAPADLFEFEIILVLLCGLIVVSNLILGLTAGFPLLSANPSETKVANFTGGLGFIHHFNGGPFLFLCCGCLLMLVIGHKRYLAGTLLFVACSFIALSGSKGALLSLVFIQATLLAHKGLQGDQARIRKLKRYIAPMLGVTLLLSILVVYKDQGSIGLVFFGLARRLLYYGDVVLYYYPRRGNIPQLTGAGLSAYLGYVFNTTLGMLRLVDYQSPLGSVIAGNVQDGFGPNAQFFVRADIYFGPLWGALYCFAIGYFIGFLRKMFFTYPVRTATAFAFLLLLSVSSFNYAIESQLFVSDTLDTLLILVPIGIVARVLRVACLGPQKPLLCGASSTREGEETPGTRIVSI